MVLWEAVLSPALQVLFDKLTSGGITDFLRRWNINDGLIETLKIVYFTNTVVLDDAEEKQHDNPAVETWLNMLKDAIHEAEDVLDVLATEALRCNLKFNSSRGISNSVRNWNFISPLNPFSEGIESRIERVIDKLEYIAKQKDVLGLKGEGGRRFGTIGRIPTTPLVIDSHVYGRNDNVEDVINLVVNDNEGSGDQICVIPILGIGGIGKTTLAQCVFNDKRMEECFDVKAWACVSENFDLISITKAILESATGKPWETKNLELLQNGLKKQLSKKKFLFVLDDVWNENYDCWNQFMIPLRAAAAAHGSKIIITTRNEGVILVMNSLPPYRLKELSNDACWSLFLHHAFGNRSVDEYPSLENLGREIVKKCKGLPLAAKCLGGLLGSNLDSNYWSNILKSNIWELPSKKSGIFPALRLSYDHLPVTLKQCFAYCSVFPKDYEFDRKQLVLLWMAEGFVQEVEGKTMEEVGDKYFGDLLSRSFFQESPSRKSQYIMHDIINDLAEFVSRKTCIRLEANLEIQRELKLFERARHFSFIRGKYDVYRKFEALHGAKRLRTFLPLASAFGGGFCYLSKKVPNDLLLKLTCLRTLSLSGYCITELPDSIGNLKLLRYFDLSHTAIKELPESICSLCNLQTLLLNDCDSLSELPRLLSNLINLRYLDISRSGLQEMPLHIGRLRSLRRLPEFIVGRIDGGSMAIGELRDLQRQVTETPLLWRFQRLIMERSGGIAGIGELRDMQHIQGSLTISKLENVVDEWDARRARLTDKQDLDEVVMDWSNNFDELRNETLEKSVLEMLQPPQKLERLSIKSYGGLKFPTWLGDPSFSSMVIIKCSNCKNCTFLPPLGQLPSLRKLYFNRMTGIRSVGLEFYGKGVSFVKPFPSLEILSFEDMLEWEVWSSCRGHEGMEGFPRLLELHVRKCSKLRERFPDHLPLLTKLVIDESKQLNSPLPRLAALEELSLKGCDELVLRTAVDLSSLISLHICNISNLTHLPERLMQELSRLKFLQVIDCCELLSLVKLGHIASLQHLTVRNCPLLVSLLDDEEEQLPMNLQYLEIENCRSLERLPIALSHLTSLAVLIINDCPKLISFAGTNFPSKLRALTVRGCCFESLPEAMIYNSNNPLEYLYISGCYDFTSFLGSGDFPTTFQQLIIDHCPNLEFLPQGLMHINNFSLTVLEIFDCSSLSSFPRGHLPSSLKTLTIWYCANLETLAEVLTQDHNTSLESFRVGKCANLMFLPNGLHKMKYLEYLEVEGCPGLLSFPEGGLPTTNLKKFYVSNCENLRSLPDHMQTLTSLQELHICDCPAIHSFPEGGFPINLVSLEIKDCEAVSPLSHWGLHRLTSLKKLSISNACSEISSFPDWLLPPTLTSLHMEKLMNLDSMSNWLQNLNSLQDLKIKECHKLHSLPVDSLPATLSRLEISDCPRLEQQCEKDFPKIDHIPCIVM